MFLWLRFDPLLLSPSRQVRVYMQVAPPFPFAVVYVQCGEYVDGQGKRPPTFPFVSLGRVSFLSTSTSFTSVLVGLMSCLGRSKE